MYRGLPCIYSSAILSSSSLLSGDNMTMLRVIAVAMILFMISQNFYPHDRVLESQAWKKAVYAGGKVIFTLGRQRRWFVVNFLLVVVVSSHANGSTYACDEVLTYT